MNDLFCRVYLGDCKERLDSMPSEFVNTVVTSPPYFGQRDYGTATWRGGDHNCDHMGPPMSTNNKPTDSSASFHGGTQRANEFYKSVCGKCGAIREDKQIGLEETPTEYVARLVDVFRSVRRVLRKDGTVWLNMGDTYANKSSGSKPSKTSALGSGPGGASKYRDDCEYVARSIPSNMKAKDLMGMPWMLAFALREDGWYLRQDCIWAKGISGHACQFGWSGAPMPESVTSRCSKAHEYIFLLSKSSKYYYDHEAIKEPAVGANPRGKNFTPIKERNDQGEDSSRVWGGKMRNRRSVWTCKRETYNGSHFACVDVETQCLTIDGWKSHGELSVGDLVATYNMNDRICEWQPLDDVSRYSVVDQEMVSIAGRGIDQLLTPNHRCLIERRSGRQAIVQAGELKVSHKMLVSASFRDSGMEFPPNLAALVGWAVAEGHWKSGNGHLYIYQSRSANAKYCERIASLLDAEGAKYKTFSRLRIDANGREYESVSWRIVGGVANAIMSLCEPKRLPPGFLFWNREALQSLWDSLMQADGHFRSGNRSTFVQKDKGTIDDVQALATVLGYSTTLTVRTGRCWQLYKTKSRTRLLRSETSDLMSRRLYSGTVWCPQVKNSTFVARRNGRVFVTGNSFPSSLIEPCVLAGAPLNGVVLDPFMGSGTTGGTSLRNNRNFVGIELNESYIEMARERISGMYGKDIMEVY